MALPIDTPKGSARRAGLYGLAAAGASAVLYTSVARLASRDVMVLVPFIGILVGTAIHRGTGKTPLPSMVGAVFGFPAIGITIGLFLSSQSHISLGSWNAILPWVALGTLLAWTSSAGAGLVTGPNGGRFGALAAGLCAAAYAAWAGAIDQGLPLLLPIFGWVIGRAVFRDGWRGRLTQVHGVALTGLAFLCGPMLFASLLFLIFRRPDAIRLAVERLGPDRSLVDVAAIIHDFAANVCTGMFAEGFVQFLAAVGLWVAWVVPRRRAERDGILAAPMDGKFASAAETKLRDIEEFAERRPRLYKLNLFLLTLLGRYYLYLFAGLMSLIILQDVRDYLPLILQGKELPKLASSDIQGSLQILVITVAVLQAAWIKIPHPAGMSVHAHEAPDLFSLIETARAASRAAAVDEVLLTSEFNASVTQIPRGGITSPPKSYLVIGLPLLQALTPDQFRAALIHEFGHLSRLHGRFSAWVYEIRDSTSRLASVIDQSGATRFNRWLMKALFGRFFRWYVPRFSSYSFVFARGNEFEADRIAAATAGPGSMSSCLLRTTAVSKFLDATFWPAVEKLAHDAPEPPGDILARLNGVIRSSPEPLKAACQRAAFGTLKEAGSEDPHPPIFARLAALGWDGGIPKSVMEPQGPSAAQALLGDFLGKAEAELSSRWKQERMPSWAAAHAVAQFKKARARELQGEAAQRALTDGELWELSGCEFDLRGFEAARPWLSKLLKSQPLHVGARFLAGRGLLRAGDPAGLAQLDAAMTRDFERAEEGCREIETFLLRGGRAGDPDEIRARLAGLRRSVEAARKERLPEAPLSPLEPHGLPPADLASLVSRLAKLADVRRAWLARKSVRNFPEQPFYVLAVSRYGPAPSGQELRSIRDLRTAFPAAGAVEILSWKKPRLRWRLWMADSGIYRRPWTLRTLWRFFWDPIPYFWDPLPYKGAFVVVAYIMIPVVASMFLPSIRFMSALLLIWALVAIVLVVRAVRGWLRRRAKGGLAS